MKKIMFVFMFLGVLQTYSCTKSEKCADVVCQNGGTCENGDCECPAEFTGTNCELLADAKEIKIIKVIITDFLETNGGDDWDESDGPDLFVNFSKGTTTGGDIISSSSVIENCSVGIEYSFDVDWTMDGSELAYNFDLLDEDGTDSDYMGANHINIADFRPDKPTVIDLPTLSGGFVGLRLEVEWIFE